MGLGRCLGWAGNWGNGDKLAGRGRARQAWVQACRACRRAPYGELLRGGRLAARAAIFLGIFNV
jgi:hypothetical protein